jgi:hypothetical protein
MGSNLYPAHDFELLMATGIVPSAITPASSCGAKKSVTLRWRQDTRRHRIAIADNVPSVNCERSFTGIVDGRRTAMNHYPSWIQRIPE